MFIEIKNARLININNVIDIIKEKKGRANFYFCNNSVHLSEDSYEKIIKQLEESNLIIKVNY